jgi:hypothetical protein
MTQNRPIESETSLGAVGMSRHTAAPMKLVLILVFAAGLMAFSVSAVTSTMKAATAFEAATQRP